MGYVLPVSSAAHDQRPPKRRDRMLVTDRLHYGTPAKVLHWVVVALLAVQFPIGWFMPDVRGGPPGSAMTLHISFGITILMLIVLRFGWRIAHPVTPESSLPPWQRVTSEAVHWLPYALVLATPLTGWVGASLRGCWLRAAAGRCHISISARCRC